MELNRDMGDGVSDRPPPLVDLDVDVDVDIDADVLLDVPSWLEVLVDGLSAIMCGERTTATDEVPVQGDNPLGFKGTCGLCACAAVLRRFGMDVREADVVTYAAEAGLCLISDDPRKAGGTTIEAQVRLLNDFGVPAHAELAESIEDLAARIEQGRGVIVGLNAGVLWDDADAWEFGQVNHAVTVTAVARDPDTGMVRGFYFDDSATGQVARFVDTATMTDAWLSPGGSMVTTDVVIDFTGRAAS